MAALASAGPPKLPKLSDRQFAELKELARGPTVHGWEDQRWNLARIRVLIARKFRLDCSSAGVWRLLLSGRHRTHTHPAADNPKRSVSGDRHSHSK
uniref:winged helix-turn-helix domain-containing protein n=1 Tax=Streptomyces shenzhenensis TaxID=943815 RepID=UPI00215D922F|nr:winged helix-turn-helix domain-containing protein [Streptomyces shenzhenensis]